MIASVVRTSPVLQSLAQLYERSTAGTTGVAARDFIVRFHELLKLAGATTGEPYEVAVNDLQNALQKRAIHIDQHRRSRGWERVRVSVEQEAELFALIGRKSPRLQREEWASLFEAARLWEVPHEHRSAWVEFCNRRATHARAGQNWKPFRRYKRELGTVQLGLVAKLLAWKEPALVRTVSVRLTHSSKFIESCVSAVEMLLHESSGGTIKSLADLSIEYNPTIVRFNGPLKISRNDSSLDFTHLAGESSLSQSDLLGVNELETAAPRCVTIENATKFHELCRLRTGDLLVLTSYPTAATVEFLRKLPAEVPVFHFGDTDPWGFDVLRVLRQLVSHEIAPLHMQFRPKSGAIPLDGREQRKLRRLLIDPTLADVRGELQSMCSNGTKGDFEQESLCLRTRIFPYV